MILVQYFSLPSFRNPLQPRFVCFFPRCPEQLRWQTTSLQTPVGGLYGLWFTTPTSCSWLLGKARDPWRVDWIANIKSNKNILPVERMQKLHVFFMFFHCLIWFLWSSGKRGQRMHHFFRFCPSVPTIPCLCDKGAAVFGPSKSSLLGRRLSCIDSGFSTHRRQYDLEG